MGSPSPEQIVVQEGDPDLEGAPTAMRFRLTYEGKLLGATQSSPRSEHKHEIRKYFHPQLKRLWEVHPQLLGMEVYGDYGPEREFGPKRLAKRFTAGNYGFAPLVMEDDHALLDISVLLLRPGPLGVVGQSGDMDNRLSTLFDALQVPPIGAKFSKAHEHPTEDEKPFYCLVSNDKLISKVTVEADVLLDSVYRRDKGTLSVKRRPKLTPDRRAILTPRSREVASG